MTDEKDVYTNISGHVGCEHCGEPLKVLYDPMEDLYVGCIDCGFVVDIDFFIETTRSGDLQRRRLN